MGSASSGRESVVARPAVCIVTLQVAHHADQIVRIECWSAASKPE